jgi:hypothetical protein
VHCRRERVVRGLRFVDVVVWIQSFLFVGKLAALHHMRAVSDHFVCVHVALRAGAGLPYHQGELIVEFSGKDFVAHVTNQVRFFFRQHTEFGIGQRRCFLEVRKRLYDLARHFVDVLSNLKIFDGTLGLGSPIFIRGYVNDTHRVFFLTRLHS